jgi:DNA-binding IclR family transcriptional regulator
MRSAEPNDAGPNGAESISAVSRVVAVLSAFTATDGPLGISELSRRTGLPKATTHRLTHEMATHGLLDLVGREFRLGLRVFELGETANAQRHLREVAVPYMADLRQATKQTIHLAVLDGVDVVYIQILNSKDAPRMPSRVGGRVPAHATGVGKAILAFSPKPMVDRILQAGLSTVGPRTITAPGVLSRQLARIHTTGIAYDNEESAPGAVCAASPITDRTGNAVAALSVSGWSGKLNVHRVAQAVHTTALTLSRELHPPS